tara:strand:+ start:260 stop:772 length:513 start_codon:yes stop_codon:yes gene_type:complete
VSKDTPDVNELDNKVFDLVGNSDKSINFGEKNLSQFEKFLDWWDPSSLELYNELTPGERREFKKDWSDQRKTYNKYKKIYKSFAELQDSPHVDDEWDSDYMEQKDFKKWKNTLFTESDDYTTEYAHDRKGNLIYETSNHITTYHMGWDESSKSYIPVDKYVVDPRENTEN